MHLCSIGFVLWSVRSWFKTGKREPVVEVYDVSLCQRIGLAIFWKLYLQVPDTGTWVLDNTGPFLCSSIVSFWITPACAKERKYHIFRQYWYTRNVPVFTNTGTFQYLGPKYTFSQFSIWNWSMKSLTSIKYQTTRAPKKSDLINCRLCFHAEIKVENYWYVSSPPRARLINFD